MNIFLQYTQSIKYCPAVLIILLIKADVKYFFKAGSIFLLADHINSFINPYHTPRTIRALIPGINKLYWKETLGLLPQVIQRMSQLMENWKKWDIFLLLPVLGVFLTHCRIHLAFKGRLAWDHLWWDLSHLTADVDKMGGLWLIFLFPKASSSCGEKGALHKSLTGGWRQGRLGSAPKEQGTGEEETA